MSHVSSYPDFSIAALKTGPSCTLWFAYGKGTMVEAEQMALKSMKTREKLLGPEHTSTLDSNNMVGLVLGNQGRYEEVEAMHRRVGQLIVTSIRLAE